MKHIISFFVLLGLAILAVPFMFSSCGGVFKTIPMVDANTTQLYMTVSQQVSSGKVSVDYRYLIAIDAVRFNQDFTKATSNSIADLTSKFIKEEKQVINYDFKPYKETVDKFNSSKGLNLDWRNVVIIDSILTGQNFISDSSKIYDTAAKFVKYNQTTEEYMEWVEHEEEEEYYTWEPWFPEFPWLGGRRVKKTRTITVGEWVKKVRYKDTLALKSLDEVLSGIGHSRSDIPEKFRNINSITLDMVKEVKIIYTLKSIDVVMDELHFTAAQRKDVQTYLTVGLAMNNSSGGSGYSGGGKRESASDFISHVQGGAIETYKKYGVLPSITIAQAILESDYGGSGLTKKANNLFGIKAFNWSGQYVEMYTTEYYGGSPVQVLAKFRAYPSWDDSVMDHGKFLSENSRYRNAGFFSATNYVGQAYALKAAGYATDPTYPMLLINLILDYKLEQYDQQATQSKPISINNIRGLYLSPLLLYITT